MSLLSANTLFHFTKKEALLGILETGFRPSYCLESFSLTGIPDDTTIPDNSYVPMVSFCDIPLSQIKQHVDEYGHEGKGYGLGMDIKWGVKKGVSPLTYVPVRNTAESQHSSSVYLMLHGLTQTFMHTMIPGGFMAGQSVAPFQAVGPQIMPSLMLLMCYLKPYSGMQRGKFRKFYDEKEWRYIPYFGHLPHRNPLFLRIPQYEEGVNDHQRMRLEFLKQNFEEQVGMPINEALELGWEIVRKHYLEFEPIDIKYIIVNSDKDIDEIIAKLKLMPYKYNEEAVNRLTTRIITYEQISQDF